MTVDKKRADDARQAMRRGEQGDGVVKETTSTWLSVFGYNYYQSRQVIVRFVVWLARRACRFKVISLLRLHFVPTNSSSLKTKPAYTLHT